MAANTQARSLQNRMPLPTRRALRAHLAVHGRPSDDELEREIARAADEVRAEPGRTVLCFRSTRDVIVGHVRRLLQKFA